MSHDTLAIAWSALSELQDLSAGLRDIIGNSTLRSIRSNYHPEETPRRFLEYVFELNLTLEAIRFFSKVDSKNTALLQDDLVSAVAHFLNGLTNDCIVDKLRKDAAYQHILANVFCSAVSALRTCAWDCRPELRPVLCKHAGKLLNHTPAKDETLWLFQTLSNLLLSHYGSETPLGQGADQTQTRWKMLWEADIANRQSLIQDMVKRATDTNTPSAERIVPILDLCQLYWDTDALLIQSCASLSKSNHLARVFYVPQDSDAIALAMEVRFAIQTQFAFRNMRSSSGPDSLQAQAHVMFRPGLRLKCVQDLCVCSFTAVAMQHITIARTKQHTLLREAVSAAYNASPTVSIPSEFSDGIYSTFAERLKRWPALPSEIECSKQSGPIDATMQVMQMRPRLASSHSVDATPESHKEVDVKGRSASQPNIHRRFSRPGSSLARAAEWRNRSNLTLATQAEEQHFNEDETVDTCHELGPSGTFRPTSPEMVPGLGRTESMTTSSTASGYTSKRSSGVPPRLNEKELEAAYREKVPVFDRQITYSPEDFEKCYPEVVVGPVSTINEDNMSLFSNEGSIAITLGSGGRVPGQQKKWPGIFKGSKRTGGQFAVPTVRFFASGKSLLAWTRYGGACFDISRADDFETETVNIGDIMLAAGGTRRYAVISRYAESYTLSVYNIGGMEPCLEMTLAGCPKAMDLSKDDRLLAIKYAPVVRIFDIDNRSKIDHKLPRAEGTKVVPSGHLVAFSHDSHSFMASTRMGPEKVVTYWSYCMDTRKHVTVQSNAPCGNIDDHGLTSLAVAGPSVRGLPTAFLSTFTEKGSPVILSMSQNQPHAIVLRDAKGMIGSRIHGAGMHVDPHTRKSNLVMVNHNNDVFWISDIFGRGQEIQRIKSLKRPKSMKPEMLVSMANSDEANIFWIDPKTQSGMLVKVGKSGGMTRPMEIRLDIEPMCSG